MMVDHTAEIATLRQKLAALAAAEADKNNVFIQERGRHNTTEADKDNAFKRFTSWTSDRPRALQHSTICVNASIVKLRKGPRPALVSGRSGTVARS
jgi:hypothetical protein